MREKAMPWRRKSQRARETLLITHLLPRQKMDNPQKLDTQKVSTSTLRKQESDHRKKLKDTSSWTTIATRTLYLTSIPMLTLKSIKSSIKPSSRTLSAFPLTNRRTKQPISRTTIPLTKKMIVAHGFGVGCVTSFGPSGG